MAGPLIIGSDGFPEQVSLGTPGEVLITNSAGNGIAFSPLGYGTLPGHISWLAPQDIGSDLSSLVTPAHQVVQYGWVFMSTTGTVDGITFSQSSCDNETADANSLSFTHSNSTFQDLLNTSEYKYSGGSEMQTLQLTLTGLTAGLSYEVQLFALDCRSTFGDRGIKFRDPAGTSSSSFRQNAKKYVKGQFVASGTTQVVYIDSVTIDYGPPAAVINMVILRRFITPIAAVNLVQVLIDNPTNGQVLKYDSSIQKWKNSNP